MGICKLCAKTNVKLVNAHIIPRSLYGGTLTSAPGKTSIISSERGEFPKGSPIGEYDKELVCVECEASFSPWDDYAAKLFLKETQIPTFFSNGVPHANRIDEFNEHKLRMFFISLLWRMHTTDRRAFNLVDVGPYIIPLVEALRTENPNRISQLDVCVTRFDSYLAEPLLFPTRLRREGINGYRVCFSRYMIWIKLDKRSFPSPFSYTAISAGSPLHILNREFSNSPEMKAMLRVVQAARH